MPLDLGLTPFFNTDEFAVSCTLPGAVIVKVILSTPDQESFGDMLISSDTKITGKTSDLSDLVAGSQVTIASIVYTVKKKMKIDDGLITEVFLSKVL